MDLGKCKEYCNADNECKFIFLVIKSGNNVGSCLKYRSCDKSREANNVGSTYAKEGKCPGNIIFVQKDVI